jgi:polyisoprenyl-phosphate glycosyltransferase
MVKQPKISVVSAIYNSSHIVSEFISEIKKELGNVTPEYELILVDDGSGDDSWLEIEKNCSIDMRIKGIKLSKNFGQQIALSAGLRKASGQKIIILDSDLQNPPEAIPLLLENLDLGFDIVYTVSKIRNNWWDEFTSSIFWYIINSFFKVNMVPNQLMMRAFTKKTLTYFNGYEERIRFIAGITHDLGLPFKVLSIENNRRKEGKGNYTFLKRFQLMIDLIISSTIQPLNFLIYFSLFCFIMTIIFFARSLIYYVVYPDVPLGYTTMVTIISFFGSTTLIFLGLIGRYLSNIYAEVRQRPLFVIDSTINIHR